MAFRATLNFQKFKVSLNATYRIFLSGLLWYNMILDKLIQNVRSEIVDLSWALQTDPFRKRLTTFSVDLLRSTVCSFLCDFIALEIMESELALHHDNFCKFHVPYTKLVMHALSRPWRQFVTERRKKNRRPKLKPWPHCLYNNVLEARQEKTPF